ncbi:ester hydrolase C11orf54 homolog isoform X3 [Leguminivora glycinivorella]|uniref:ester hydrolase C11orf54 homolog isoform X3 n=1 Tax=Leguminivora glycinivorella TaxID=1035111 RepID=UPI00200E09E8|nr:ester hydrolase C11orf54 homolog isoform X3 [Leguminivora glycinivorella]
MLVSWLLVVLFFALVNGAALRGRDASMTSVDYAKVPILEKPLHKPPLEEIVEVLSRALKSNFESVAVSAEVSPDLTQEPYSLTAPGLCGNEKLIELGGPPYLMPSVQRDKVYDLAALAKQQRRDPAFLAGAGAGPWPYIGVNCEGIINLSVRNGTVDQGTRVVSVHPVGAAKGSSGYQQRRLPNNETRTALLGNYLLSDGSPGKVIKVVAKKRIGEANFITAIREALKQHYGDKVVGLGGMFLLRAGKVKHHVMPDFSPTPLCSDSDVDNWLHYFEMRAPITHVGTMVTGDLDLDLRVQHFHGWGAHGDGGHYHYDTTPDAVEYEGYFTVASSVVRIDAPAVTHDMGRD